MVDKIGIRKWIDDLENNEELLKKFEAKESPEEIVVLAKEEGYEFTVDEFMDLQMEMVSGGKLDGSKLRSFFGNVIEGYGKARKGVADFAEEIIDIIL